MGINPCGMGMDLLRSCYETDMYFWQDSTAPVRVRWFFCDADAKVFPHWHRFGSGNWASDKLYWPGVGEVLGAERKWVDGAKPEGLDGQHFCGPLDAYQNGATDETPPLNTDDDGICCCCTCKCECVELISRFADEVTVTIMAIVNPQGIGFVGQQWKFTKNFSLVPPYWEGPEIATPGGVFPTVKLYVHCLQVVVPDDAKELWFHISGPPYDPIVGSDDNLIGSQCTTQYVATRDGIKPQGGVPGAEEWTVKVVAAFTDAD